MGKIPKALLDYSSGKYISLLLDGNEVPGAVRVENISSHSKDERVEITITIVASELKKKDLNGKIEEI